MWASCADERR